MMLSSSRIMLSGEDLLSCPSSMSAAVSDVRSRLFDEQDEQRDVGFETASLRRR